MNMQLFYVTSNTGKFGEVDSFLRAQNAPITLVQKDLDIPEIQTMDQREIAIDKAKKAWSILQAPLIVDDAGVYFEKYNQFPGTMSKFVSLGLGFDGIKRLIDNGDRARFALTLVYVDKDGQIEVFEGVCKGALSVPDEFSGHPDLPYDVFFIPDGASKTCHQMRSEVNEYSHYYYRLRAVKKFLNWYQELKGCL